MSRGPRCRNMGAYGYSKPYGMEQRLRDGWGWGTVAAGAD